MLKRLFSFSGFKLGIIITLLFCASKLPVFGVTETGALRFLLNIERTWLDNKFRFKTPWETGENLGDQEGLDEAKRRERLEKRKKLQEFRKNSHVVIVAVDERSLRMPDLGMWPWPRSKTAVLIEQLNQCGARVIGFDMVFAEPDASRIEPVVRKIRKSYEESEQKDPDFAAELEEIYNSYHGDKILAETLEKTENAVLGYFFFLSKEEIQGLDEADVMEGKESIGWGAISFVKPAPGHGREEMHHSFRRAFGVRANLPMLSEAAGMYGFFSQQPDDDKIYRRVPMVISFDGGFYPSLSLQVLSAYYNQPIELLVNTVDGESYFPGFVGLYIGPLQMPGPEHVDIPVERGAMFRVNFYGGSQTFRHVSAGDIIHRADPDLRDSEEVREACAAVDGKIVLVGVTTMGIYDLRPTPLAPHFPGVEIHANVIENVIRGDFMIRPTIFYFGETIYMLLAGILFSWLLTRFRLTMGLVLILVFLVGLALADYFLLFKSGIQAHVVIPFIHIITLFLGIAVYRYVTEEREKSRIRHTFQFYLSKDVIDEMLESSQDPSLGGERRELTVLFSDIRGFTTISEKLDPAALAELLNEYLTPMTEIVLDQHGTLDKYIGDALMAIFGAPLSFSDHPHAACRAALQMMESLNDLCGQWRERGLPEIDIGIGINTGIVSVGNMGSARRFDYTVLGDNVNLASRLEGLNKAYGSHIIISQFTRDAVGGHFTCRELDAVQVKGKLEPVKIYELVHRGPPDKEKDGWIEDFHEALYLYRASKFEVAAKAFGKLESDAVARMYVGRCHEMKENPPGPDWDGVYKMTTK